MGKLASAGQWRFETGNPEGDRAIMARVIILYGTTEGQTASISEYIAEVIRDHGHEAEMLDIKELPGGFALGDFKAVIV